MQSRSFRRDGLTTLCRFLCLTDPLVILGVVGKHTWKGRCRSIATPCTTGCTHACSRLELLLPQVHEPTVGEDEPNVMAQIILTHQLARVRAGKEVDPHELFKLIPPGMYARCGVQMMEKAPFNIFDDVQMETSALWSAIVSFHRSIPKMYMSQWLENFGSAIQHLTFAGGEYQQIFV